MSTDFYNSMNVCDDICEEKALIFIGWVDIMILLKSIIVYPWYVIESEKKKKYFIIIRNIIYNYT